MRPTNIALPSESAVLYSARGCITYWAVEDTSGSGGSKLAFYDGQGTNGALILPVTTNSGQSTSEYVHKHHLTFERGLYYSLTSGTIIGSVAVWIDFSEDEWAAYIASFVTSA